jgi:hypothetical protein
MPSQQMPQANVNGVHHPRVATERPRLDHAADRATKPPLQALPRDPTDRADGPSGGTEMGVRPRRPVRIVPEVSGSAKERRAGVYIKHALMHPWHVVVLAGATVFGVANWSLVVLLLVFAGAELLLLGIVLRLGSFRRYVDERLDQIERANAAEQRATLLLQMGDEHRRELLRLEGIVDRIRDATKPHGTAAQLAVDECLRLLASYVRLAIAFNVSRECLASVDRGALDDEIRSLESARFSQSTHTRALAQRRVVIARKRAARWDRSRESLDAIAHQLAMVGELVQLTHEQVSAPADPGGATEEIDRVVEELDDNQSTIDELAELLGVEEGIEPRVLDIGRAARG